jgi:Tfp pilus assembly protein PilN
MMPAIDLLPEAYRHARRRERRFRLGLLVGALLLGAELAAAAVLYLRADETRKMLLQAEVARAATRELDRELEAPTRDAERLAMQVAVAERLRTKHRWSRLLALLAETTPDKVVITAVSTDPPQWSPALRSTASGGVLRPRAAGPHIAAGEMARRLIEGVTLSGYAAEHGDLSAFMAALHASQSFADLDLRQARRDRYLGREAILFELQCRW